MSKAEELIDHYINEKKKVPPSFKKWQIKKGDNKPKKVKEKDGKGD